MLLNLYGTFLAALLITNRTHALHIVRTKPLLWFTLEREREISFTQIDIARHCVRFVHDYTLGTSAIEKLPGGRKWGRRWRGHQHDHLTSSNVRVLDRLLVTRVCCADTHAHLWNWNGYSYPLHNAVNVNRCEVHSGSHYSLGLCARTHTHSHTRTCVIM